MSILKLIRVTVIQVIKQAWLLPQSFAVAVKQRRQQIVRNDDKVPGFPERQGREQLLIQGSQMRLGRFVERRADVRQVLGSELKLRELKPQHSQQVSNA